MKNYLFVVLISILGVVAVSGCTSTTNSTSSMVTIENSSFNPAVLTVPAGTTVMWTNKASKIQNIVSNTGIFSSGNLSSGMIYKYTFNKTGTYPYHSTVNTSMKGTIIVTNNTSNSSSSGYGY